MNLKRQIKNRVSRTRAARWIAVFALGANSFAGAQPTNHSAPVDFSSFQIIPQRNIFNPDRYPQARPSHHHATSRGAPTFFLAGTMSYRKGMFAFFDGTSSDYRKAVQAGGTIAGYTVAKINFTGAELQSAGKTIEMKVGAGMRQEGDGWQLNAPDELPMPTASDGENTNPASEETPAAQPASSQEPNDVLKKLMQQREQELK